MSDKYDKMADEILEEIQGVYDEGLERPVSRKTKSVIIANELRAQLASKDKQIERLRDALREIAYMDTEAGEFDAYYLSDIARAALAQEER